MNRILLIIEYKKNISFLYFFIFSFFGFITNAQVANYSFAQTAGSYSEIAGANIIHNTAWDDAVSFDAVPIGFDFNFNGIVYTTCSISTNGFITFGETIAPQTLYAPIDSVIGIQGIVSALGIDLESNGSPISQTTIGTAPYRTFVVQWKNARRYKGPSNENFNFQIRLSETSNVIRVIYGSCVTNSNTDDGVQVGLRGANNSDFNNRTTSNNWSSSTVGSTNSATSRIGKGSGELPSNGLTYSWSPSCAIPITYTITGSGGSYCSGLEGSTIGLSNSQMGINYQLFKGSVAIGSAVSGTGAEINFGTFNATGTYTVLATRTGTGCTASMSGSVSILSYSSPPIPTATPVHVSCPTDATGSITVTNVVAPASLSFLKASNQHIDFNTPLLSNKSSFTVEGWIKFDPANYVDRMALFGQNDVIEIAFENNNLRCWTAGGGSVDLPLSSFPNGNTWHHIAVTGDGTVRGLKIYLDGGVPITGGSATSNYGSSSYTTKIGWGVMDAGGVGLTGEVFKLGFWNRALTATEITKMAAGFVIYDASQTGLLAGYSFNEGTGTTVSGVGSVAPLGTFINSPTWKDPYGYSWTSTPAGSTSSFKNLTGLTVKTYNLTTSLKGCENSGSWTVNFTNPAPTITTIGTINTLCFNSNSQLATLIYTASANSPVSYRIDWNAAANTAGLADQGNTPFSFVTGGGNLNSIVVSAGIPVNTYTGIMTITNANGCVSLQALTLTIIAKPTVIFTVQPGATVCSNEVVTYTTQAGQSNYVWGIPGILNTDYSIISGGTSLDNTLVLKWLTVGSKSVTVNYSNVAGCSATTATSSNVSIVLPIFTSGTIQSTGEILCSNDNPSEIGSTTAASGGDNSIVYKWQANGSDIPGATGAAYDPPAGLTVTTTYVRFAKDNTCNTTFTPSTGSWVVTVNPNLPASVSIIASTSDPICSGTSVTFKAIPINGGAATYQWYDAAVPIGGETAATYTSTTLVNGNAISVKMVSSATPCLTGSPTTSNVLSIIVNAIPISPILNDVVLLCNDTTFKIGAFIGVPGTIDYKIDVSKDSTFSIANLIVTDYSLGSVSPETTLVGGLTSGETYYARVRAVTSCGTSDNSLPVVISVQRTYYNGSSWTIAPNATLKAVFTGNANINTPLKVCSCQIDPGVKVVVGVPEEDSAYLPGKNDTAILKLENGLNVLGTGSIIFENNASLLQVNEANDINSGSIIYKRNSTPMKNFDYTYWSSPVKDQVLKVLSPNTFWDKYLSFSKNKWVVEAGANKMNPSGKGFIIRVPKPGIHFVNGEYWTGATYVQKVEFVGVPINGAFTLPIDAKGYSNLIGNPYPSAMSADAFLLENSTGLNPKLEGTIRFWTHNTVITNNKYSGADYASYNYTGGVGTSGNFIDLNSNGIMDAGEEKVDNRPNGFIVTGQSFMVKSAGGIGPVVFNNTMRVDDSGKNAQFFKGVKSKKAATEKHRVWLNLSNNEGAFKQLLVGYVEGATNGDDNAYDGASMDSNKYIDFYSVINNKKLVIQGRAVPFENTDLVPLGYKSTIIGTFVISIDQVDGVLASQDIYLEDKVANVIHNLKKTAYSFSTEKGVFANRFVLRYTDVVDSVITPPVEIIPPIVIVPPVVKDPVVTDPVIKDPVVKDPVVTTPEIKDPVVKDPVVTTPEIKDPEVLNPNTNIDEDDAKIKAKDLIVSVKDHQIKINSFDETIGVVMVYDLRGRLLYQNDHVNQNEFVIQNLDSSDQFLIVITRLINGVWVSKEIVF